MGLIEAVYVFNERKYSKPFRPNPRHFPADSTCSNAIVTHTFTARPPPATTLLPLYLAHSEPRPSCIYLTGTNPPTLLFSMLQDGLLFMSPCSTDTEPLVVLEFLHRVADALEEFLGAPLLASKLEANYDVIAQVLSEMCDGGLIGGTEANALRDVVDTPSWMGKLLGGVGLPGYVKNITALLRVHLTQGSQHFSRLECWFDTILRSRKWWQWKPYSYTINRWFSNSLASF